MLAIQRLRDARLLKERREAVAAQASRRPEEAQQPESTPTR